MSLLTSYLGDKVLAEHPEYTQEDLEIKVSAEVRADDEKRKALPHVAHHLPVGNIFEAQRRANAAGQ